AVKGARAMTEIIVGLGQDVIFPERLAEAGADAGIGSSRQNHGSLRVLLGALAIQEEKQLVLDDRPAKASAELVTLEGQILSPGGRRGKRMVANKVKRFAMEGVGAGACGYIDRPRGGQVLGEIQRGLTELKFVNRTGRYVCGRGTHGFIAD